MEPNCRLIQDIERSGKTGTQLVGKVDPLILSAGKGFSLSAEGEIVKSDLLEKGEFQPNLSQYLFCNISLKGGQVYVLEKAYELGNRHIAKIGNVITGDPVGQRFAPQSLPHAYGAGKGSPISAEEDPHVEFVSLGLQIFKEIIDTVKMGSSLEYC